MTQRKKRSLSNDKKGLWIQCCNENCKKWRFVKEYKDPLSVPEKWFCSENYGKFLSNILIRKILITENRLINN